LGFACVKCGGTGHFCQGCSGNGFKAPTLRTILPTGCVEDTKDVHPKTEGGLMCYTHPQHLGAEDAEKYLATPFVWKRNTGTFALVQIWPMRYNDTFRSDFKVSIENPDPDKFSLNAVEEFKIALSKMFGAVAVHELGIKYCYCKRENNNPVYVGQSEALMVFLTRRADVRKAMNIPVVGVLSFECDYIDKQKNTDRKKFVLSPNTRYYLYTKDGEEKMAMVKTWDQFEKECSIKSVRHVNNHAEEPPQRLEEPSRRSRSRSRRASRKSATCAMEGCARFAVEDCTHCCRTCLASGGRQHGPVCSTNSYACAAGCARPAAVGFSHCCRTCSEKGGDHCPHCNDAANSRVVKAAG